MKRDPCGGDSVALFVQDFSSLAFRGLRPPRLAGVLRQLTQPGKKQADLTGYSLCTVYCDVGSVTVRHV